MNLNDLANDIHEISKSKGFWPKAHNCHHKEPHTCGMGICDFTGRDPYRVLALVMTEVAEAIEALRDGANPGEQHTSWQVTSRTNGPELEIDSDGVWWVSVGADRQVQATDEMLRNWGYAPKPEGVPSELADIIIRVLDACAAWGIDIDTVVGQKIEYNHSRPHKHGRLA